MNPIFKRQMMKGLVGAGVPRVNIEKMAEMERPSGARLEVAQNADGARAIYLYDVIDEWGWPFGVSAGDVVSALAELGPGDVELRLNSPGGATPEAFSIYNALNEHSGSVHVVVDGWAVSAASVVAMAGDRITMNPGAEMMVHNAWFVAAGDHHELRAEADRLERTTMQAAEIYSARTGRPLDAVLADLDATTWMFGSEAAAAGYADDVAPLKSKGEESAAKALWPSKMLKLDTKADVPGDESTPDVAPDSGADAAATAAALSERQRAERVIARVRLADSGVVLT